MFRTARGPVCLALALALPVAAPAADGAPVGDWQCDGTRVIITRLGSIEVMEGGRYRAGLYEVSGDALVVTWDGGGGSRVVARQDGGRLALTGLGRPLDCERRR